MIFPADALRDCRRLFLRDYELDLSIGWHAFEKKHEQRVILNVELWVPLASTTPRADQLDEVVDYDLMREAVLARVRQGHIHLQETLVDDIARELLAHPQVRAVRVTSEKPDAYPDCASVGVEVFHMKEI
ncbi:dihydroneopterin aldolase [Derxia gummosa]|uniref:dihydroneopterin aldolase n=1 Tax=Derxia gummosa DSM 723 TaxID=1121388 RepID=A0A8B6X7Z3_9BURK|nr:dihydroneopterin aldolase [Derxia gummosa]